MKLDLYVPGLMDRLGQWKNQFNANNQYPALEWILSRSELITAEETGSQSCSVDGALINLFSSAMTYHTPVAALRSRKQNILCADPVHMKIDVTDLYLSPDDVNLNQQEQKSMMTLINSSFSKHGIQFSFTQSNQGLIQFDNQMKVRTTPITEVYGKGIKQYLPGGEDASLLLQLMNEIQMTLHSADFNLRRKENHLPQVNALWIWGEGDLPAFNKNTYSYVVADGSLERLLCDKMGIPFEERVPDISQLPAFDGTTLIVMRELWIAYQQDDDFAWFDNLKCYEEKVFSPLKTLLKRGAISELRIMTETGLLFHFQGLARFKFWQRVHPLSTYLS